MLKGIGALCIILSASAVGFGFAGNIRRQARQTAALVEALGYLKSEILYRRTALPQALETLGQNVSDPAVAALFARCAELLTQNRTLGVPPAFRAALAQTRGLMLPVQAQQTLLTLSLSLGQFDLEGQSRALELAAERLSAQLRTLEQGKTVRCRSYATIGICAGMALAVILL